MAARVLPSSPAVLARGPGKGRASSSAAARPPLARSAAAASALRLVVPQPPRRAAASRAARLPPLSAKGKGDKKAPPPPPPPPAEEEEDDDLVEVWTIALAVTAPNAPAGTTHGAFCDQVKKALKKSVPMLPTREKLREFEMEDDEALVVITDQEPDEPFNPDDDAVFAEMMFFSEDDAEQAMPLALDALQAKGWVAEMVDDDEDYDEDDEDESDARA